VATTTDQLTESPAAGEALAEAARKAQDWAGEAFLHEGEDPVAVLAPGTARRRALDEATAEIERGLRDPSYQWKVRYGLMLGLERVLFEDRPKLAAGRTELRRHQVDALAGMLTELIHANQREDANGNGNGAAVEDVHETVEEEGDDELGLLAPEPAEAPIPARCAASGSATRRRPARRSPRQVSSRPRGRSGS
jgi:ribonuclease E